MPFGDMLVRWSHTHTHSQFHTHSCCYRFFAQLFFMLCFLRLAHFYGRARLEPSPRSLVLARFFTLPLRSAPHSRLLFPSLPAMHLRASADSRSHCTRLACPLWCTRHVDLHTSRAIGASAASFTQAAALRTTRSTWPSAQFSRALALTSNSVDKCRGNKASSTFICCFLIAHEVF